MRSFIIVAVLAAACEAAPEVPASTAQDAGLEPSLPTGTPPFGRVVVPVQAPEIQDSTVFLMDFNFDERIWYQDLPGRLNEVSGLAFTPDGRLFAHDDERARVHEIDPATAEVGKRFDLGEDSVRGDFEGLAIVNDRFFLITSAGLLYEFREGADRDNMSFRLSDTNLADRCEVEGLDYDSELDALLVACKTVAPERGVVVVHRLPMEPGATPLPDLTIHRADLEPWGINRSFAPSGVAVTPLGTVLIISGRDDALIEVDRDGRVVAAVDLRGGRHPQSEGLAIGPDGTIYISDERNGKAPRLTAYGIGDPETAEGSSP